MTVAATLPRRAWVEQIMGLPISLHVRGPWVASPQVERAVARVFAALRRADDIFSTYRSESQVSRWARGELPLADADPDLAEVLTLCEDARRRTGGAFDARSLPDPIGGRWRYDPSGLVKGWAVERAARHLATIDGHGWCINAGGDIIMHSPAGHPPWRVGIENPIDPSRLLRVVTVADGAVATSGGAHRGAHLIDPRSGRPATATLAASVMGPSLLWADVYATAAAVAGAEAFSWLGELDGYEALLVTGQGTIITSPGWPHP